MSSLLKDVLLPEKIKSYYLFSKTVVGIEINKTHIIATKVRIKGTTSTIEQVVEEKISEEVSEEDFQRTSPALTAIFSKIGSYDEIHTVLPSSIVVFKELRLPFTTRDRISMVIGFEIEPLLPFPLREAVIDFIITREIPEEKSSEVLVTAVQKQQIAQHLAIFEAVGIRPEFITIDMIALYGLYKQVPAYKQLPGGSVLINITGNAIAIGLIINGQLKTVRTLPKGIVALTKQLAQELTKTPQEALDYLLRFGVEPTTEFESTPAIEKAISDWWDSVNFTLTSFSAQFLNRQPMSKIIFIGNGSLIKGFVPFIAKKTTISCELFSTQGLEDDPAFTIKNINLITPLNIISASAALPLPTTVDYNLAKNEFSVTNNSLLLKQLIVLVVLTVAFFTILITHYFTQTIKLKSEIESSEKEAVTALTTTFKNLEEGKESKKLDDDITEDAERELKQQKERWFKFSNQSRTSFLQYLFELSKLDRKSTGLKVEQITIGDGYLTIKGSVRDDPAVPILERQLKQSKLLSNIEGTLETPEFTVRILLVPASEEIV